LGLAFHIDKAFVFDRFLSSNQVKFSAVMQVTRLIPDAKGTTCNQRLERVSGTEHTHILRVPFRSESGTLRKWISRFDVWPYLETYSEVIELFTFP